jgi:ABC-2 type transport system permease protein
MEIAMINAWRGANPLPDFWLGFASLPLNTVPLVGLMLIIIAGGIIASEYAGGTIKSLLINPVARWKFLVAKYVTVLSVALILLLILFVSNFIFAGLLFGFSGINVPFLNVVNGEVVRGSALLYVVSLYLLSSVGVIVLATFAFMLSALVRSSALAIGLGVCLFFGGFIVVSMLQFMGFYQARFIFFANTDLIAVMNGTSGFVHHTLTFALVIIAVHMLIFLWTAWDAFTRTDVK